MKNILLIIFLYVLMISNLFGQSLNQNYIHIISPNNPISNVNDLTLGNPEMNTEKINYFDGFGNPTQSIEKGASPNKNDIVNFFEFDIYGREPKKYLPFRNNSNSGNFVSDPISTQASYYQSGNVDEKTNFPFHEQKFEKYLGAEPYQISKPGNDWHINSGHTIQSKKRYNRNNDNVLKWKYNYSNNSPEIEKITTLSLGSAVCNENFTSINSTKITDLNTNRIVTSNPTIANCPYSTGGAHFYSFFLNNYSENKISICFNNSTSSSFRLSFAAIKNLSNSQLYIQIKNLNTSQIIGSINSISNNWDFYNIDFVNNGSVSIQLEVYGLSGLPNDFVFIDEINIKPINISTNNQPVYYNENTLSVKESIDENQQVTIDFFDDLNNLILSRKILSPNSFIETYYVYNSFNLLASVIQPNAVKLLASNSYNLYSPINLFDKYVFNYIYDGRKRLIEKRLPGGNITQYVYDKKDRLVLSQDNIGRNKSGLKEWDFVKYDEFGRIAYKGIYKSPTNQDRQTLQNTVNSSLYLFEVRSNINSFNYTSNCFPSNVTDLYILSVHLYGTYDLNLDGINDFKIGVGSLWNYTNQFSSSIKNHSLPTITRERVLGSNLFLDNINFYNDLGQVIVSSNNQKEGSWIVKTYTYNFKGQPLITKEYLDQTFIGGSLQLFIKEFVYDHAGRLIQFWITPPNANRIIACKLSYSDLGKLKQKKIHSTSLNGNYLQTVDYKYNINGWLKSINEIEGFETNQNNGDLFAYKVVYNENSLVSGLSNTPLYNGNVSSTQWISSRDNVHRGFNYSYDNLNRITEAEYFGIEKKVKQGVLPKIENNRYNNKNIEYDENGNIKTWTKHGLIVLRQNLKDEPQITFFGQVDNLTYEYDGNILKSVTDAMPASQIGLIDFSDKNKVGDDYTYNSINSLIGDKNKSISNILYNEIDLPQKITWQNGDELINYYNSSGQKLETEFYHNGIKEIGIKYLGSSVFKYDKLLNQFELECIAHEEGRLVQEKSWNASTNRVQKTNKLLFYYDFKDHLGNVRMTYTPKLDDKGNWMSTYEDDDFENDVVYPGDVNNPEYDPDKPRFKNWSEPIRSNLEFYNGRYSGKVVSNEGTKIKFDVQTGDTISASVYAKVIDDQSNTPGPSWLLDLVSINTKYYRLNSEGGYDYIGPPVLFNIAPVLIKLVDLLNGSVTSDDISGALVLRTLDSADQVLEAYAIPAKSSSWEKLDFEFNITDEFSKKAEIFISAKQGKQVFFDDLSVQRRRMLARIVQENHYYPFGLNIQGLEYLDALDTNTFSLYNGKEDVLKNYLECYDYGARYYSADIARFTVQDPRASEYEDLSPYAYVANSPLINIDPNGEFIGTVLGAVIGGVTAAVKSKGNWEQTWKGAAAGAVADLAIATGGASVGVMVAAGAMSGMAGEITHQSLNGISNPDAVVKAGLFGMAGGMVSGMIAGAIPALSRSITGLINKSKGSVTIEQLSKGEVIPKPENGGYSDIYRAASQAEVDDVAQFGLRMKAGGYEQNKLFAPTIQEATQFGKYNFGLDGIPNTILKVRVPNSVLNESTKFVADDMNAIAISANQLTQLQAKPLNFSPWLK